MEVIAVNGELRPELGKKGSKAVRNAGRIPCVLYGGDEVTHFSVAFNDVRDLIYTPDFKLAEISLDGKVQKAILKDAQFHPVSDDIRHIDFLRLVEGAPIKVEVPVRFKGVSPGVKVGGKLQQKLRRVKIKTTPDNLIDELHVDISSLELGDSVRVRDIEAVDNIEILNSPSVPLGTVETPRALRSAATAAAKEEAQSEG
ncbi:MAG: 50S ribosomal protein L25 [Chitinophagales bacterium]|nr:50S ribosomal protein L25 [Chitinophagales bacterium]